MVPLRLVAERRRRSSTGAYPGTADLQSGTGVPVRSAAMILAGPVEGERRDHHPAMPTGSRSGSRAASCSSSSATGPRGSWPAAAPRARWSYPAASVALRHRPIGMSPRDRFISAEATTTAAATSAPRAWLLPGYRPRRYRIVLRLVSGRSGEGPFHPRWAMQHGTPGHEHGASAGIAGGLAGAARPSGKGSAEVHSQRRLSWSGIPSLAAVPAH